ncbi:hypothetical protein [Maribellus comscasis]|uniref:hypothetical protein n=1 Tax=Maribellus comscasis TaxID=2681766 RepID=UPI00131AFF6F|nr:hypothetical protein [Maribellus comscasis]
MMMENEFKEGEVVRSKFNPTLNLVISKHIPPIYYCRTQNKPSGKEVAYFENELLLYNVKNIGVVTSGNRLS